MFSCVINYLPDCDFELYIDDKKVNKYKNNSNFITFSSPLKNDKHLLKLLIKNIRDENNISALASKEDYKYSSLVYLVSFSVENEFSMLQLNLTKSKSVIKNQVLNYFIISNKITKNIRIINEEYTFPEIPESSFQILQNLLKTWNNQLN